MNKEINNLFKQARQESMVTVAHELMESLETHGVEYGFSSDHVMAIFCLERSIKYVDKPKLFMAAWLTAGYEYAESANVEEQRLDFAMSLLDFGKNSLRTKWNSRKNRQ
jgi:hypothetical protein